MLVAQLLKRSGGAAKRLGDAVQPVGNGKKRTAAVAGFLPSHCCAETELTLEPKPRTQLSDGARGYIQLAGDAVPGDVRGRQCGVFQKNSRNRRLAQPSVHGEPSQQPVLPRMLGRSFVQHSAATGLQQY